MEHFSEETINSPFFNSPSFKVGRWFGRQLSVGEKCPTLLGKSGRIFAFRDGEYCYEYTGGKLSRISTDEMKNWLSAHAHVAKTNFLDMVSTILNDISSETFY